MLVFYDTTNTNNEVIINIISKSKFLFDLADISENGTMECEQKL